MAPVDPTANVRAPREFHPHQAGAWALLWAAAFRGPEATARPMPSLTPQSPLLALGLASWFQEDVHRGTPSPSCPHPGDGACLGSSLPLASVAPLPHPPPLQRQLGRILPSSPLRCLQTHGGSPLLPISGNPEIKWSFIMTTAPASRLSLLPMASTTISISLSVHLVSDNKTKTSSQGEMGYKGRF